MHESTRNGPLAELVGHPVEVNIVCGCTAVKVVQIGWLLERFWPDATIDLAERRLRCRECKQRPRLTLKLEYAYRDGRDRRVDPEPLPGWVVLG